LLGENRVHPRRNEQWKDEQTGVAAAFGDQIGDSLNPLEPFRVKRVIPLGSQVVEIAGQICALLVSLRLIPVQHAVLPERPINRIAGYFSILEAGY